MTVRASLAPIAVALLVAACELPEVPHKSSKPGVADLGTGMAMLSGHVVGADGSPVMGATVKVRETGATATSGADGTYAVAVPGDTSLMLEVASMGNATTLAGVVLVPGGGSSMGYELLVVPQARVDLINMVGGGTPKTTGVVAVRVGSVSGRCSQDGASLALDPIYGGKAFYALAGGGVTDPDPNGAAMPAGTIVGGWLTSIAPPSSYYRVTVSKPDCKAAPVPVTANGRSFSGLFQVQPGMLTLLDAFME